MLLAGDIGATKTALAVFEPSDSLGKPLAEATFPSDDYDGLEEMVSDFLGQVDMQVECASFGVAGPVADGRAKITNLPWEIEESQMQNRLEIQVVRLLNDLEAIAGAIPWLETKDLHTLNEGQPVSGGSIGVVAPGTGLGEAFLSWDGERYRAHPSEGGHTDFAPRDSLQAGLLQYLKQVEGFKHVSYERVCSGMGMPNIYAYLKHSGYAEEQVWLREQLAEVEDPTPVIANAALAEDQRCALCEATLNTFVTILGAEAGNLALKVLATGGIYLGGGIPRRILPALEQGRFLEAFIDKGRFTALMSNVPVHVIINPKVALLGAAYHGLETLEI
jgi:glucokinase